jgi:hypothetical protein
MTFSDFIQSRRASDSPRGDFIADTQMLIRLGRLPEVKRWSQLEFEMRRRGACPEAIRQGRRVWREFERHASSATARGLARRNSSMISVESSIRQFSNSYSFWALSRV